MKLIEAVRSARKVFIAGNGGSAANAIHLANDLVSVGIDARSLAENVAILTAVANDFGYEHIFSRQLRVFAQAGDLLIVLSGSGESPNIIQALEEAKALGVVTFAIVGGGMAANLADHKILTPGGMQAAENAQLRIGHALYLELKQ